MKKRNLTALCAIAICATTLAADPVRPIVASPTQTWDPGQLVWADLLTPDVDAAKRFYSDVFDWQFTGDNLYSHASHDGVPVAGIAFHVPRDPKVSEVAWLVSVSVDDVDAAADAVVDAGGKVLEPPRTVAYRGRFAIIEDPDGAVVVLLRSAQGDPADRRSANNEWIWAELWSRDPDGSARFYESTVGYSAKTFAEPDGNHYLVLAHGGKPKTGIVRLPWQNVDPHWLPYLRVADVVDTVSRVEAAGGAVLVPPRDEFDAGSVAIVSDPTGGVFAIQQRRTGS